MVPVAVEGEGHVARADAVARALPLGERRAEVARHDGRDRAGGLDGDPLSLRRVQLVGGAIHRRSRHGQAVAHPPVREAGGDLLLGPVEPGRRDRERQPHLEVPSQDAEEELAIPLVVPPRHVRGLVEIAQVHAIEIILSGLRLLARYFQPKVVADHRRQPERAPGRGRPPLRPLPVAGGVFLVGLDPGDDRVRVRVQEAERQDGVRVRRHDHGRDRHIRRLVVRRHHTLQLRRAPAVVVLQGEARVLHPARHLRAGRAGDVERRELGHVQPGADVREAEAALLVVAHTFFYFFLFSPRTHDPTAPDPPADEAGRRWPGPLGPEPNGLFDVPHGGGHGDEAQELLQVARVERVG